MRAALRVIDANRNRATEALRVVEDLCRFHWSLRGFAAQLKDLRHGILAALEGPVAQEALLAHRDIEGDVGRDVPSPPTPELDLSQIALRNLQRAREALRTLEELSRAALPEAAGRLEGLRYGLYAVEKGLGRLPPRGDLRSRLSAARLCLLATSRLAPRSLESLVSEAIRAGVDMVQLREKELPDRTLLGIARALREVTAREGALFIVNDRPDLALLCHADGVHLGQEDLPPAEARSLLGESRLVGVSTHSLLEARAAQRQGADYVGVGPVYPSPTKDAGAALAPAGLAAILAEVSVPAFAIGGIHEGNLRNVVEAGASRIAVSSAILRAADVAAAARGLAKSLRGKEDATVG